MLPGWGVVKAVVGLQEAKLEGVLRERFDGLRDVFLYVGRDVDVDPGLLAAIARWESAFRPEAVGPELSGGSHARGLMQITDGNLDAMGIAGRWRDPETNIRAGAEILRDYGVHEKEIGSVLARYGGFVTKDPNQYVQRIVILWARMRWREGMTL